MSTQPGVTSRPEAGISRCPGPTPRPTAVMRSPSIAMSAARGGVPLPSTRVPPRITRSCIGATLYEGGRRGEEWAFPGALAPAGWVEAPDVAAPLQFALVWLFVPARYH